MQFLDTSVYRGPNVYALFPVIRHTVDLGVLEEWPTGRLGKGFVDDLVAALPGLADHGCSYREPGGLIRRMLEDEGTWLGHVLEHMVLELQGIAGYDVSFGKTRSTDETGVYDMVFEFEEEFAGIQAGELGLDLLHSLLPKELRPSGAPDDFDFAAERDQFIRACQSRSLGPSTHSLVKEAEARDVPWIRLNEHSLIQLGHGRYQQRLQATITSATPHIAVELASEKDETNRILGDLGLPVPRQALVYRLRRAIAAAERIGYPVVLKPLNANHGRGVTTDIQNEEQVEKAYDKAKEHSDGVIVETFLQGLDHRLLVVGGQLVAAAKRVPAHVVGDGSSTVEELVAKVNEDPLRGVGHEKVLTRISLDAAAERMLNQSGMSSDSVPGEGDIVYLQPTANLSTGGTSVDVTDVIHPDNKSMAERAILALGLDVGGVDFITTDITRSYGEVGGGICECNAAPGFRMHVAPSEGEPRNVAGPVIDMLFPEGSPSSIPIAAITGTNGKTTTSRMLAHILKMSGLTVGQTSTDGVYIDGRLTVAGDMTGPTAAQIVLRDPSVNAAVMETARGGILRSGLGYQRSNVSACLNIAADHLGLKGVDTLEDLAEVKRVVVEVARDAAVLNADDVHCLQMADHCTAEKLCYVTMNRSHPLVREHIKAGGTALVLEQGINGGMITLYDEQGHNIPLLWTHLIPATLEGRALHNVQNAMFAAALAYHMNVDLENIRQGLRTFDSTFFQSPGRLNVYDKHPFKVILDYAHNPAAVKMVCDVVDRYEIGGRKIVVLTMPGDRRDEDIVEVAGIAAGHFDHYICRRDDNLRGREPGEVPGLLKRGLLDGGVSEDKIQIIESEEEANQAALDMARGGDLLLILADHVTRSWKQIIYFQPGEDVVSEQGDRPAIEVPEEFEGSFSFSDDVELIRDERGVRIARESDD
ncbi:cyanophycin synthetase [Congregibacter sp.]|uniref:cyanophycin synthetase n=1 Tax=Congregibacter sp. TaxID=2744308 RepID=UPI003F6B87C0